ncbi:H/ACA ribonucleoprotein complex non-core subunit NAF1 [Prunus yedoensis var. nudiflora]|uniref:H/ACA ribonucleoprotein complex non-core subunit NAF1 n=1 Tax=Prunus yedoensis var. nudiflora TaxID=2094558 RepID=A0A314YDZ7_PRUYE|nr:H/ACA ribonucleoprotein complex non-core subunit NAF1 [Prunus yedoensis var. nudiflora]
MAVKAEGKFLMCMTQLLVGLNRLPMGLCQLVVWRRSEISENLSCSVEEELGKVSLLGGCDQNSVLDGRNCMKSEVTRNSGGGEPENN